MDLMTHIEITEAAFVAALLLVGLYALIKFFSRNECERQEEDETELHRLPEADDPRP